MKKTSARSKHYYEKQGYIVASVEKWNSFAGNMIVDKEIKCECGKVYPVWKHAGIRIDLFKFADLLAFHPDEDKVLLIQSSAGTQHSAHKRTIMTNERAAAWVNSANRIIVLISWSLKAPRDEDGKVIKNKDGSAKKHVQTPRVEEITYEDFQ